MLIVDDPTSCNGADTTWAVVDFANLLDVPTIAFDPVCAPADILLEAPAAPDGTSWTWIAGSDTLTGATASWIAPAGGTWTIELIAVNPGTCNGADTVTADLIASPAPTADFSSVPQGLTVSFSDESESAVAWLWEFGDGTTSEERHPDHTYAVAGTYEVCLTVDNGPCTDRVCRLVELEGTVVFPNAFSPGGDGLNDVFRPIVQIAPAAFHFQVFNRWGDVVFETTDPQQGWDGTFRGIDQEVGTYVYRATIDDRRLAGSVHLIR